MFMKAFKRLRALVPTCLCLCIFPVSASATDNTSACDAYAKVGGYMVGSLLPRTVQDFVDMMTGKNPEMMADMVKGLTDDLSETEMLALSNLGQTNSGLLSESAGHVAIRMLMAGQTTSKTETIATLRASCLSVGPETIIANQKTSNAAVNANIK